MTKTAIRMIAGATVIAGVCLGQTHTTRVSRALDVCTVTEGGSREGVTLRGTGRITPDGFVIGDRTCPLAKIPTAELPSIILVDVAAFSSKSDQAMFEKIHFSRYGVSDPFQALVRGDLKCQVNFRFQTSDDGDIVTGNGYGPNGLIRCRLLKAQVLVLRQLE